MSTNMSARPISAAERVDDTEAAGSTAQPNLAPPLPPCLVVDAAWEHFAERGLAAWEAGQRTDALTCLRRVARLSAAFAEADPRRIAARASLAAAESVEAPGASAALADAAAAWDMAAPWVAAMTPAHKPRSSLYHHRLERKHVGAYAEIARQGYRRLLDGGRAACLNNLALARAAAGALEEAQAMLREAARLRERALGARDLGALRILSNLADVAAARSDSGAAADCRRRASAIAARQPIAPLDRFRRHRPQRMTDVRRLEAAVLLVPVLRG
jgi:hypothetical protein